MGASVSLNRSRARKPKSRDISPSSKGYSVAATSALIPQSNNTLKRREQLSSTNRARAEAFVRKFKGQYGHLSEYDPQSPEINNRGIRLVNLLDLVYFANCLFDTQDNFRAAGVSTTVDLGYHYTSSDNMPLVCQNGLLTKADREAVGIQSTFNGATFGDGVYTSNNPYAYHQFKGGQHGLFVARLQGSVGGPHPNTVVGNTGKPTEVVLLTQSSQSLVLLHFHASQLSLTDDRAIENDTLYGYHVFLQTLIDECFNDGVVTKVPKILPSAIFRPISLPSQSAPPQTTTLSTSPSHIAEHMYTAPDHLFGHGGGSILARQRWEERFVRCSVCLDGARLGRPRTCPACGNIIGPVQGDMPCGKMKVEEDMLRDCHGHFMTGTIIITYDMKGGVQKAYHGNFGVAYEGTHRVAYIPNNIEGRGLLKRLEWAFLHGLTFTIGRSLTTGKSNVITWSLIPHKTSTTPGLYGYPDRNYFTNAHQALDALRVPPAAAL